MVGVQIEHFWMCVEKIYIYIVPRITLLLIDCQVVDSIQLAQDMVLWRTFFIDWDETSIFIKGR
jgi:hypothetical protein